MIVEAAELRKSYGATEVLAGVDLRAPEGSVLALLGPNGAGKTTTVRILTTLTRPDAGHATIAAQADVGFVLESVTWRANADWGALLGYDTAALDRVNQKAIDLLVEVRADWATANRPYPISGCLGPRDDGYAPGMLMTAEAARAYHRQQIATFADTPAD